MNLNPRGRVDTNEFRRQLTISYRAGGQATRVPTSNLNDLGGSKVSHDPIKNVGIDRVEPPIATEKFAVPDIRNRQSCQLRGVSFANALEKLQMLLRVERESF